MLETFTRGKALGAAAALALSTCAIVATASPASARPWGWHHHGFGWGGAVAAGVIGGAFAAATSPLWAPGYYGYDYPGYGGAYAYEVAPGPAVVGGRDEAYCAARFRSYNPATGTYLGYDGLHHPCP